MGEELAAQWYLANGYALADRNWVWRSGGEGTRIDGEIDLVGRPRERAGRRRGEGVSDASTR